MTQKVKELIGTTSFPIYSYDPETIIRITNDSIQEWNNHKKKWKNINSIPTNVLLSDAEIIYPDDYQKHQQTMNKIKNTNTQELDRQELIELIQECNNILPLIQLPTEITTETITKFIDKITLFKNDP